MSADPASLLRMLEPAVRPAGVSGVAPRRAGGAPFESKPFEQLLQEARVGSGDPKQIDADDSSALAKTPDPLADLAGIARIENASLREQLEKARAAAPQLLTVSPESPSTPE